MELDISTNLREGIKLHKQGKLQAAERLFRSILAIEPNHPDANHNLGVLAVSLNKTDKALLFFERALEVKSKNRTIWLSYIDSLIKLKKIAKAFNAMVISIRFGVRKEAIAALENVLLDSKDIQEISGPDKKAFPTTLDDEKYGSWKCSSIH